ncbi:hypothetical protein [Methylorubrum extorquens]
MMDLRAIAHALRGEVAAGQVLAPAPGHSARDRPMSIRLSPRAPGGLLVHLFSGGDPLAAKDHVLGVLGCCSAFHPIFLISARCQIRELPLSD